MAAFLLKKLLWVAFGLGVVGDLCAALDDDIWVGVDDEVVWGGS